MIRWPCTVNPHAHYVIFRSYWLNSISSFRLTSTLVTNTNKHENVSQMWWWWINSVFSFTIKEIHTNISFLSLISLNTTRSMRSVDIMLDIGYWCIVNHIRASTQFTQCLLVVELRCIKPINNNTMHTAFVNVCVIN